jgi:mono/diheme cytochrome c family protein
MNRSRRVALRLILCSILCTLAWSASNYSGWMKHVPDVDRMRVNPYAGQTEAIAAGGKLFADHCAKCHGVDALGSKKRPNLRAPEVQRATDGELFWILRNGDIRHGMPSWSSIPEPSRWQIIAYVKSLGEVSSDATPKQDSPQ